MIRDVRIDTIGCIKELVEQLEKPTRDAVKASMAMKKAGEAEGDLFEAKLLPAGEAVFVNPEKFLALLDGMSITRKEFLSCLTISTTAARELLSAKDLAAVSKKEKTAPSLRVSRRAEVIVDVKTAAAAVIAAVENQKKGAA